MEYIAELQETVYEAELGATEYGAWLDSRIVVVVAGDEYEGDYTVTPRLEDQVLPTGGYLMRDDLTVREIPISRVSNPQDGLTVIIG